MTTSRARSSGTDGTIISMDCVIISLPTKNAGTLQAAAVVSVNAAAMRANRLAIGFRPTHLAEGHFRRRVRHLKDVRQGDRFGLLGKEEMLGHLVTYRLWKLS
jgi:hypothetical protein